MPEQPPDAFDPYATLQLHANAPFDLIVEAYWALSEEQRTRRATPGVEMRALNAAYRQLIESKRIESSGSSARRGPSAAATTELRSANQDSCYTRLAVAPHACATDIEI